MISLSNVERRHSIIEREALCIHHGLEKFHHYCFAGEASIITDNKKDVTMLSQRIQWIQQILRIHQYWVRIIYKPGPDLSLQTSSPDKTTRKTKTQKYLACNWKLMSYRQWQTSQIAWQCSNYNRQPYKMITYNTQKITLSQAAQGTKIRYHKICKHTRHFEMMWQWLIGLYSKAGM